MPRFHRLLACLLLWSSCHVAAATSGITLANGEWPPYLSNRAPHAGFASHLVSEAFRLAGVQVAYDFYPWARAEALVKNGAVAGSVVWATTPERRRFALFSDPVIVDEEVVFHLRMRPMNPQNAADLRGLRTSIPAGYRLGVWEQPIQSGLIHSDTTLDARSGMAQLLAGYIDFFPMARTVGEYTLRREFSAPERARVAVAPKVWDRVEYRLMLSRKAPDAEALLARFNQGLARLKASPAYTRMLASLKAGEYD